MRPIKFDLPLNGTRIATLEQLEDNLTPEIFEPFRSGKLAKWLRARSLDAQAEAIDALLTADVQDEVQLFIKLCEVFEREVDEDIAVEMIEEYKTSSSNTVSEKINEIQQTESPEEDKTQQMESEFEDNEPAEDLSETQLRLLEKGNEAELTELAAQPNLSEKVQSKLASTGTPAVREALANNPALTEQQQNYLVKTGSQQVKCQLAKNLSLIPAIQSILVGDEDSNIRQSLASNPSLEPICQSKLIDDGSSYVRRTLASNPSLTDEFQQLILNKDDVVVDLAKNSSLSETLMEKLVVSNIKEVKESLASNISLPEFLQARLIADNSSNVREVLASNPSLKTAQQAELLNVGKYSDDIRLALFDNPSLDELLRTRIIASFNENDLSRIESQVKNAKSNAMSKEEEWQDARSKYSGYDPHSLFGSMEKYERLEREECSTRRIWGKANHELGLWQSKFFTLKSILNLSKKTLN